MKADFHAPHIVIDRFVPLLDICQRIDSDKNFDELLNIIASEAAKLLGLSHQGLINKVKRYGLE